MSKKARRRPTWKYNKRKIPRKHQTARYTLPYLKYWTINFYDWWDRQKKECFVEEHILIKCGTYSLNKGRVMPVAPTQAEIMRKVFNGLL